jgi:hypothetical protein
MKYLVSTCLLTVLTGCATPPAWLADHYNSRDLCQVQEFGTESGRRLKPAGYTYEDVPKYCGQRGTTRTIYNPAGQVQGYIR